MALDAGSVFVRLVGLFDSAEFDKWDKAVDSERTKSDKPIEIKLGADTAPLEKDLTEARGKVSRWARTQDKFKLAFDRGSLDADLTQARSRIGAWGNVENKFKLGFGKGDLDTSLADARARIARWGDFENKFNLSYNKTHLAAQLVEARAEINAAMANLGDVKINVNTTAAMARIAALRAAADMGGGGGGGGGGGAAAADGAGGFERGLQNLLFRPGGPRIPGTRLRIGLGGLSLATALGLGPEHVVGAAGALGGSAIGAGAGAGALALGALGQFAVGGGSDIAITKSTITQTQTLTKALDAVDQAEARYGKNSNQAKIATFQLNQQMSDLGNTAGTKAELGLAKATEALGHFWNQATSSARVQSVNILTQVLDIGRTFIPLVNDAATQNLSIINKSLQPLFAWIKGPNGIGIFHDLEAAFKQNLPTAIDAFNNAVELLLRLMQQASNYTGGFTAALDAHLKKWNDLNNAYLNSKVAKVVNDFREWEQLIKDLTHDLAILFHAGSGEGNDLVNILDHGLKVFGAWEQSAKGQSFLHQFFYNRQQEMNQILGLLGQIIVLFGHVYAAVQPLVPAVTLLVRAMANGLTPIISTVLVPIAKLLADILQAFVSLGDQSTVFKNAVIVPLGLALISWRLFGASGTKAILDVGSHVRVLRGLLTGMRAAMGAIFAGEGVGSAWQRLKDAMKPGTAGSPAASMQEAIVTGHKEGAAIIEEAIVSGHKKGAAMVEEAEVVGGAKAGAEEEAGTAAGGAVAGAERYATHPLFGTPLTTAEEAAAGTAGGGGLLAGARRIGGTALRTAGRLILPAAAAYTGAQLFSNFSYHRNVLGQVGSGALAGAGVGAGVGTVLGLGVGDPITAPLGALLGGVSGGIAGLAHGLLGIGGEPKQQKDLEDFRKKIQEVGNGAHLTAAQIHALQNQATALAKEVPSAAGQLNTLWHQLSRLPAAMDARQFNRNFNLAWKAIHDFTTEGGASIAHLKDRFDTNMRLIAHFIGLNTDEGRKLAGANIQKMVNELTHSMVTGKIKVADGMKLMRQVLDDGMKNNETDWNTSWQDMMDTLTSLYKKHKISAATYWSDLRSIYKQGQQHIADDENKQTQWNLWWLKKQRDDGLLSQQEYNKRVHEVQVAANAQAKTDTQGFAANIAAGYASATLGANASLQALWKTTNSMLKVLHAPGLTALQVGVATGRVDTQGAAFLTHGSGVRAGSIPGNAQGGPIPGGEFGHSDNMTLVDPHGVPRAKMAGDEWVFTKHQAPYVDMGLRAIGFGGGADELWSRVNRPHGYERGGALGRALKYLATGGYVYPFPPGSNIGRTDQGVDVNMPVGAPIGPMGRSRIMGFTPNWYQGQPFVWWKLLEGARAGQYAYAAEQINNIAPLGSIVNANQAVAHYAPSGTGLEYGWATSSGATLARATSGYTEGQVTGAGQDIRNFITGLAHGRLVGGALGGVGIWRTITPAHLRGHGPIHDAAQAAVNRATAAANRWGNKEAGQFDFGGISGGGSNTQNEALGLRMMMAAGWGAGQWPALKALWTQESGWSTTADNPSSGAYGIAQALPASKYASAGGDWRTNPKTQISWGLQYIKQRYGSPDAAEAHERQYNWYFGGGPLQLLARGGRLRHATRTLTLRHPALEAHAARAKKPPRAKKPTQTHTHRPPSLASYVGTVPGAAAFSADDAKVAALEDKYNRQEQIFSLYDSTATTTGNLPIPDLDVLSGIRMDEWNILDDEYTKLPSFLDHLHNALNGRPLPRHPTAQQKRHARNQAHRHATAVHRESSQYGGANVVVPEPGEGINKLVAEYETAINKDEAMVYHLRAQLRKDTEVNTLKREAVTQKSINLASSIAGQQAGVQDKMITNLTNASLIMDQIDNLPVPQTATPLGGLTGTSYAQGQAHNSGLAKTNAGIRAQRQQLYKKRNDILRGNIGLRAQLEKLQRQKNSAALSLRQERFDIAWAWAIKKYGLQERIDKIVQLIKLLKSRLAREKKIQTAYQNAYDSVHGRLYGGDAQDPSATDIQQQMGDVGFDILSLIQEGADNVPPTMVAQIKDVLTKLGIQLPEGAGAPGAGSSAPGQAFDDFLAFQASRANLFATFGSNFVAAGANPFAGAAGIAAGTQYYGAAAGSAGGGFVGGGGGGTLPAGPPPIPGAASPGAVSGQGTTINITQHFGGPPPDAHTYAAGLDHEMSALM